MLIAFVGANSQTVACNLATFLNLLSNYGALLYVVNGLFNMLMKEFGMCQGPFRYQAAYQQVIEMMETSRA